jgi:hypothetical protein
MNKTNDCYDICGIYSDFCVEQEMKVSKSQHQSRDSF